MEPFKMEARYLRYAFGDIGLTVEDSRETLKDVEYDTMVGVGLSGALVIPALARALGKYFFIVRKSDGSHSSNPGEGKIGQKWIFVDDFIASGTTRELAKSGIELVTGGYQDYSVHPTKYVGTYQYYYDIFEEA